LQAEREAPSKNQKKLSEFVESIKLAAPKGAGFYNALPPIVKKAVETQAALLAQSQPADIEKIVSFQFASSETGTEDVGDIESDIDAAVSETLEGSNTRGMSVDAAAGNVVAHVASQARMEHFFDPEVLAEIESFTFENNDPVSAICQALAGTTFAVNDPQLDQYGPPLHHNAVISGTKIKTATGDKKIEDVFRGDMVLTHAGNYKPVYEVMDRFEDKHYFEFSFSNGSVLNVTGEHPILTKRGWVRADALLLTDYIMTLEDINNSAYI
jgi:hypothetical protein